MKYLICNLKSNFLKDELIKYEEELNTINYNSAIELVICPSTPFLYIFKNDKYKLGSQDVSMFGQGAHTGENTAEQLSSLNVKYALVGHSERRALFKEEEKTIIEKIKKSYHSHIKPIYFIGEKTEDKIQNKTSSVLEMQLFTIIDDVPDYKREKMIIVYEPVWAIGTGEIPNVEEITNRINFIKNIIRKKYQLTLPVLYGGSVNKNNIDDLVNIKSLDGFVLGESSKEINNLIEIYEKLSQKIN